MKTTSPIPYLITFALLPLMLLIAVIGGVLQFVRFCLEPDYVRKERND
jgi:hypothetical protein